MARQLQTGIRQFGIVHQLPDNPHCAACSALRLSPSSASPIARARPATRGRNQLPPQSGTSPSLLNAITNLAERAASTISQPSAGGACASGYAVDRADNRFRQRRRATH